VDELLLFWEPGVYYKKTALRPFGRRARAAMIPLVCDLVGARQVAGVGAHNHSHMLCTCCSAAQDDIEDSTTTSTPRNLDAHRAAAIKRRDAESTLVREYNFARTGIRWSELLRLGYWNPILYVVVDSMHNLYLGLLQRHIRDIWGISTQFTDGDASGRDSTKAPPRPSPAVMNIGLKCLLHKSNSQLAACAKPVLYHLCVDRNLRRAGPARILLKHLIAWVLVELPLNEEQAPSLQPRPKLVGTGAVILEKAASSKALIRRGLPTLKEMCKIRGLPTGGTRAMLANRLWDWVSSAMCSVYGRHSRNVLSVSSCFQGLQEPAGPATAGGDPMVRSAHVFPPTAALGRETLSEYVRDRSSMQLPSWVNPAPLSFGTTQHGKLSADQWRTVSTINLPITLIRTWGLEDGRRSDMLRNFLKLVEAIVTLGYWEADIHGLAHADRLLREYLEGVKTLYKGAKIQPNHHLALHLTMFIALFGPVHAWRSFAFERFNFMLQSLNINANFGELEMTFMMQSCRMANLGPILRTDNVKKAMPSFRAACDELSQEDKRGMRSDETMRNAPGTSVVLMGRKWKTPRTVCLEDSVYGALRARFEEDTRASESTPHGPLVVRFRLVPQALTYPAISISGVVYKVHQRSAGDSNIIFRHPSLTSEEPGRIILIFTTRNLSSTTEDTFLAVERLSPLTKEDQGKDPYRRFGETGGLLYYDSYETGVLVIRPHDVVCHYAKTSMKGVNLIARKRHPASDANATASEFQKDCVHVLKLGKVSL
ncbi:hypothetical protein LXA43DRAFT_843670, partial [Ganoderma leucocontextum]